MTRKLPTAQQKQLAQAQAKARQVHLADCPHSGHWVDTDRGVVRCPCWRQAQDAARRVQEQEQ